MFSDSDNESDSGSTDNDINTSANEPKGKNKRNKQTLSKTTNNVNTSQLNDQKHRADCDDGNNYDNKYRKRKNSNIHLASTVPTLPVLSSASSSFCCS